MRCIGSEMSVEFVIERRHRADRAAHHRHRVRVAPEALEEAAHLLVDHRVAVHAIVEVLLLRLGGQFAVEQQVAGLEEVTVFGELLDRVAAIEQDAFVAVDVGDLGLAASRRGEARVVGEDAGLPVELGNVDHVRTDRAFVHREGVVLLADGELRGFGVLTVGRRRLGVHGRPFRSPPRGPEEGLKVHRSRGFPGGVRCSKTVIPRNASGAALQGAGVALHRSTGGA